VGCDGGESIVVGRCDRGSDRNGFVFARESF